MIDPQDCPIPLPVQERFLDVVQTYRMFEPGDRVIIGVSGGKDSFTLLDLCGWLRPAHFPDTYFTAAKIRTDIT